MFAVPNARHSQVAYVTNDLDGAAALLEKEYGIPGFYKFDTSAVAQPGDPQLRIGLARVGGVEIELIEPLGDTPSVFAGVVPRDRTKLAQASSSWIHLRRDTIERPPAGSSCTAGHHRAGRDGAMVERRQRRVRQVEDLEHPVRDVARRARRALDSLT